MACETRWLSEPIAVWFRRDQNPNSGARDLPRALGMRAGVQTFGRALIEGQSMKGIWLRPDTAAWPEESSEVVRISSFALMDVVGPVSVATDPTTYPTVDDDFAIGPGGQ